MLGRLSLPLLLLGFTASFVGCTNESETSVRGSVTFNGAPVSSGYITFNPTGSGTSFAAPIVDGKFTTQKAYAGQYQVLITSGVNFAAPKSRDEAEKQRAAQQPPPAIPEDAEGNNQTVEVKPGEQTLDFALTGPPRQ
jgi:hypothetical protein